MEKKHSKSKLLSLFLCMVSIVAMTLFTTGCNGNAENEIPADSQDQTTQETKADTFEQSTDAASAEITMLGEGEKQFLFTMTDAAGIETAFEIHTDKETVGEALLELGLVSGDMGDYGLYVKTVNGITADYDEDGTYWAFYVNGEYAASSADLTTITEGDTYSFKVEK